MSARILERPRRFVLALVELDDDAAHPEPGAAVWGTARVATDADLRTLGLLSVAEAPLREQLIASVEMLKTRRDGAAE